jgi:hypothetical protein
VLTTDEWETLKWRRAGGDDKPAQSGTSTSLAREMALESYCVELSVPNYPNSKYYPSDEPEKLFLSCFGYGAPWSFPLSALL